MALPYMLVHWAMSRPAAWVTTSKLLKPFGMRGGQPTSAELRMEMGGSWLERGFNGVFWAFRVAKLRLTRKGRSG